ncbi:MAG: molybdenum cofactor sulfurase [Deltaproteobacteria bacterium RIFOXYD12_FULL_57_12]|nr:MAG: molybdenum cofactor sulfurase [Deltaproteobacteria bacterium RIFOXYD12_FULL_57_12]
MGTILSINISTTKGTSKEPVETVEVRPEHGLEGDAHAGDWHRQVSLLAQESIDKMRAKGLDLAPGAFAENLTTSGLDLTALPIGTRLVSGAVELEITQIGKKCHTKCNIYSQVGDCIMPKEGVFARVITAGLLHKGAEIIVKERP